MIDQSLFIFFLQWNISNYFLFDDHFITLFWKHWWFLRTAFLLFFTLILSFFFLFIRWVIRITWISFLIDLFIILQIVLQFFKSLFKFNLFWFIIIDNWLTEWFSNFSIYNIIKMVVIIIAKIRATKTNFIS